MRKDLHDCGCLHCADCDRIANHAIGYVTPKPGELPQSAGVTTLSQLHDSSNYLLYQNSSLPTRSPSMRVLTG